MKDLKFEQKSSLSRLEAADQLSAIADGLGHGGNAELKLGPGTLGLRGPGPGAAGQDVQPPP
ncbi:amphi-Trp domain-containing protein, partial [Streptomyces sp. WM6378]|uniref:amphi-Trp domain-containing protein n=1 Tax=Streptomyces sp. WM6378 TaxID=1415557 RepID=UPI001F3C8C33